MRVALTHYSPVPDTLAGEPLEIYPFLGSYLLGAGDRLGARRRWPCTGTRTPAPSAARTPGGVRVRNVAHPVIKQAYSVFHLGDQLDTGRRFPPIGETGIQQPWS